MSTKDIRSILGGFTPSTLGKAANRFGHQIAVMNARAAASTEQFGESCLLAGPSWSKDQLRALVGKTGGYPETVGGHPDFDYLGHDQTEHHYIVSVFADIKGSTKLATKLPLEDVRQIKNGSLTTMLDIVHAFDGHVHRLQGDGVLAFFGRKGMRPSQAIIDALNAVSFLQYFFQNVLRPMFEEQGYPPIRIRVGVDFGPDDKVLWSRYGIRYCDEVTTTSMHTDLASKLQGRSKSNGVMIGDNVRSHLDLPNEFYCCKMVTRDGQNAPDRYVLQFQDTTYNMWEFDWEKYLRRFLINPDRLDTGVCKAGERFRFECYYKVGESWQYYHPNSVPLPKGVDLEFRLSDIIFRYDTITWRVNNRGEEATNANQLDFEMKKSADKKGCLQSTAYKGHHYMICTMKHQGRILAKERIGVYVNDN